MSGDADLEAWLRLTLPPGVGGESQRRLLAAFGSPQQVLAATPAELGEHVPRRIVRALLEANIHADLQAALAWAAAPGNHIVTLADPAYPRLLLEAADPPTLLYVKGRVELLNSPALAVVGSRSSTAQGAANAEAFAQALAEAGLTIVSGLALGIDAAAHQGGLRGVGSTVAVIGTGADRVYPARNHALATRIAEAGAIVAEFPLGTPPLAANFPRRNRVISGLARGCLVVEAALSSGSLITARLAGEQGREVFAIPGSIHSPQSRGCHRLIRDGAKLVESAADILEELRLESRRPDSVPQPRADSDSSEDAQVLDAIGFDPCDFDTLFGRVALTQDSLYAILLRLELDGRLASLPGGRYQRVS